MTSLDPMALNISRGHVLISSSLIGHNVTLHCSAVNVIDSVSHDARDVIDSVSRHDNVTVTFSVVGR